MGFQISALDVDQFVHLFGNDDETLAQSGVTRIVVDKNPGYPCRVSLQDVEAGESALLLNYEHLAVATAFRSCHAIYVREWAEQARPVENEVPGFLRQRLLSVRAFDGDGMMIDADVVDGEELEALIESMLANDLVSYLHIHNAKPGCYAAMVERSHSSGRSGKVEFEPEK